MCNISEHLTSILRMSTGEELSGSRDGLVVCSSSIILIKNKTKAQDNRCGS